jgi:flagellar hook-basal body complex protein FliE
MSIDSIASVANVSMMDPALGPAAAAAQQGGFSQMVAKGLDEVNQKLLSTQTDLQKLAVGDVQNLHQVMINLEEARMSFQLLMQVRNRVLEAYQDVMKMSV